MLVAKCEYNKMLVDYFNSKESMRNYKLHVHGWEVTLHKYGGNTVTCNCNVDAKSGEVTVCFNNGKILIGELTFTYDWELMTYDLFEDIFKVLCKVNIVI